MQHFSAGSEHVTAPHGIVDPSPPGLMTANAPGGAQILVVLAGSPKQLPDAHSLGSVQAAPSTFLDVQHSPCAVVAHRAPLQSHPVPYSRSRHFVWEMHSPKQRSNCDTQAPPRPFPG